MDNMIGSFGEFKRSLVSLSHVDRYTDRHIELENAIISYVWELIRSKRGERSWRIVPSGGKLHHVIMNDKMFQDFHGFAKAQEQVEGFNNESAVALNFTGHMEDELETDEPAGIPDEWKQFVYEEISKLTMTDKNYEAMEDLRGTEEWGVISEDVRPLVELMLEEIPAELEERVIVSKYDDGSGDSFGWAILNESGFKDYILQSNHAQNRAIRLLIAQLLKANSDVIASYRTAGYISGKTDALSKRIDSLTDEMLSQAEEMLAMVRDQLPDGLKSLRERIEALEEMHSPPETGSDDTPY